MASASGIRTYGGHGSAGAGAVDRIDGFSHLVLEVADLDRAEAWYRDVLGLDPVGRGILAEPLPHAALRLNTGQLIVLVQVEKPEPRRENTSSIHHAFLLTMEQYRAAQERFKAAGYDISDTREQFRARGEHSMDIYDPDDHRWQVQAYSDAAHEVIPPAQPRYDCGPADRYAVPSVTTHGEGNFFLIRERRGFRAVSRWCMHMNGKLTYQPEHYRFFCNFHGATYDESGCHIGHLPNIRPLRQHPVTLDADGHVWVEAGTAVERGEDEPTLLTPYESRPVATAAAGD